MDFFGFLRCGGLLASTIIGLYRLYKNYLRTYEKWIYVMATFSTAWFFAGFIFSAYRLQLGFSLSFTHSFLRAGWPLLTTTLILMMLYYRRRPS